MDEKIEEMAKIISSDTCDKDCSNRCAFCGANAKKEAKNLYNAGYRKESDTAKEILQKAKEFYYGKWVSKNVAFNKFVSYIEEHYGVEVE